MKKQITYALGAIYMFSNFGCEQAKDLKDSIDAIECAELLIDLDEEYDHEDKSCEDIKKDVDKLLSRCREWLTEENIEQLEFYKANCSEVN